MKEDIAIRAAKLFPDLFPAWKHDSTPDGHGYKCVKCGKTWQYLGNDPLTIDKWKCTVPDPIDINWDNAMKLRDEMRNSRIWNDACYEIWQSFTGKAVTQEVFWRDHAKAEHYILAACVAKETKNEAM